MTEDDLILRNEVTALLDEAVVTARPGLTSVPVEAAVLRPSEAANNLTRAQRHDYGTSDDQWLTLFRWAHVLLRHGRPNWAVEEAAYTDAYHLYRRRFDVARFKPERACMELLECVGWAAAAAWRKVDKAPINAAAHVIVHAAWMRLMFFRQEAKK